MDSHIQESITIIKKRFNEVQKALEAPDVAKNPPRLKQLSQEQAELAEAMDFIRQYEKVNQQLAEAESLIADPDMFAMAEADITELTPQKARLETSLKQALIPRDPTDARNAIIEIRAGAGGDEAGLFAAELYRMYHRFAEQRGYRIDLLSSHRTGIGGFKEVVFQIKGSNAYGTLKYESGVHRVQRVPETEKAGRVHTSTVTVAIMPEAEAVDIDIKPGELRVDKFRASGAGGQHVNKTESAIRIAHIPTGMIVSVQDEKSQHKNKEKAMSILRARLLMQKQEEAAKKESDLRRSQIGTGDRSEKIRTYNFPQSRVTDHRIGYTTNNLETVMEGNLRELFEALRAEDDRRKLARMHG